MKSTRTVAMSLFVAGAFALSSCGGVDRAGTKANILKGFSGSGISAEDQKCVANLIDKYSDSDLKKMDAAFKKSDSDPTDPLAIKFIGQTKECVVGTIRTGIIDQMSAAFPAITADQKACVTKLVNAKSAAEIESGGSAFGEEIAKTCLV
jgi:hypothetical protein